MSEFKAGDKVICIQASSVGSPGKLGEILTVAEGSYEHGLFFKEYPGRPGSMSDRFAPYVEYKESGVIGIIEYKGSVPPTPPLPDTTNPKDRLGIKKPQVNLVPPASIIYQALAMEDGAVKYGPYNWRTKKVRTSIYLAAAKRHLDQYMDGEELAEDSQKPHLGHALACIGIIVDALETGNLEDDRPAKGAASALIAKWTKK